MLNDLIQQVTQFIQEQVTHNDLFKGGLVLGLGATLLAYARAWPAEVWGWIVYHATVELDIPEGSEAFKCVDKWLSQHHYSEKRARRLTAWARKSDEGGYLVTKVSPAPGRHFLWEGHRLVIVRRNRDSLESADHKGKAYSESFTLQVIGRSRKPALAILDKAYELIDKPDDKVTINYCDDYGMWFELIRKTPRPIKSILLPDGLRDRVVEDAKQFLERQEFYRSLGVPWRRGYLFHGAPGNGKSSFIYALASTLQKEISYLNLKEVTDTTLMKGIGDIPSNSILVIEDIDCIFNPDNTRETKATISFAGLINALDGVASPDGQLLVMTTNYRDRLDPALIRPGRVDMEIEFRNATAAQASELFQLFYPSGDVAAFKKAYEALPQTLSMAALQAHFLINGSPERAVSNIRKQP